MTVHVGLLVNESNLHRHYNHSNLVLKHVHVVWLRSHAESLLVFFLLPTSKWPA